MLQVHVEKFLSLFDKKYCIIIKVKYYFSCPKSFIYCSQDNMLKLCLHDYFIILSNAILNNIK